jgi:hypothetical protein
LPPTPNRLAHTPLSPSLVDSDNSLARKKARLTRGESDAADTSDDSAAAAPKQPRKGKKRAAIPLEPTDHDNEQRGDGNVDRYAETRMVQQAPIAPVGAPNTKSTVFALLPLMLASNANNPYAPTDPIVRQHYLNEVQQRQLHPLRTLPDYTNSAVKACVRGGLFERFFCGFSISECVNTYNSLGGAANASNSAKAVLKDAAKWFNEENVVVPWAAMRDPDKKCSERFGLGKQHFPTPHETKTGTGGPVVPAPRKRATEQTIAHPSAVTARPRQERAGEPVVQVHFKGRSADQEGGFLTEQVLHAAPATNDGSNHTSPSVEDTEDGDMEVVPSQYCSLDGKTQAARPSSNVETPKASEELNLARKPHDLDNDDIDIQVSMRDQIRATLNLFGNEFYTASTAAL